MARIPSKIGKYPIEAKVAEGGMGAVYKGTHPTLNRPVILKRLTLKNSEHLTERFRREARIMMDFKNENIVNFYDHFKAGDSYYIVLEYIDGTDLSHLLTKERYLSGPLALFIFRECCKALKYAHKHQVIHRDIKPANIMFNSSGEVKLVDFGVAREGTEEEAGLTTDGMTVGTPSYMAPEQFQSSRSVDNRADIYSMGVMLYQMVTGKKPFPGGYSPELIAAIQRNKYLNPRKINPQIDKTTLTIIKKCMKGPADKRYKNMDQILSVLDRYFRNRDEAALTEELKARVAGEEVPPPKKSRFPLRRLVWGGVGVAALSLIMGISAFLGLFHEYLFTRSHGRLNLEIHVNGDYKEAHRIYKRVEIFKDDDQDIPDTHTRVIFRPDGGGDREENYHRFRTLPLYLETGRYRIKIQVEDLLYWHTVYLPPRSVQKEDPVSRAGETLLLDARTLPVTPVTVNSTVKDCFTARDLSGITTVSLARGADWIPLESVSDELLSGEVYRFRFEAEGYYPKEYSLKIYPYQKVLNLNTVLTPLSARLTVAGETERVRLTLNGSDRYIDGSAVGSQKRLEPLGVDPVTWELTPGVYLAEFNRGRKTASVELNLASDTEARVTLSFDEEGEMIIGVEQ